MLSLWCAIAVGLPGWVGDAEVRPARRTKTIDIRGDEAPDSLLLLPPRRTSSLTVEGPGRLSVELYGLAIQRRRRTLGPGTVTVSRDGKQLEEVSFAEEPTPWTVAKRRRWQIVPSRAIEVELEEGANVLTFTPDRGARGGYFLFFQRLSDTPREVEEPEGPPPAPPEPPPLSPEPPPPDELEPELVAEPSTSPVEEEEPGFEIVPPAPPSRTVSSAEGDGFFLQLDPADELSLIARGTGVLVFDFHAHRKANEPATLEPAVLAVLLDDVLVDTLRIDAPASEKFSMEAADFALSERAQFQVTVPPGSHRVTVTLSDTALAGASIRVRFESPDVATVAGDDGFVPPEPPPMVEITERPDDVPDPSWVALGLGGGSALGNSSGQLGYAGTVDFFVMPRDFGRVVGLGLTSGFRIVRTAETIADGRSPSGATEVELAEYAVPLLADLRLALDLGDYAVLMGAGGGALLSWAETRALGSTAETGTQLAWALAGHVSLMARTGAGWLTLRGQLTVSDPFDVENLRQWDPGALTVTLGYTFSSY